jgi:hypothetical protein
VAEKKSKTDVTARGAALRQRTGPRLRALVCGPTEIGETGLACDQVGGWLVVDQTDGARALGPQDSLLGFVLGGVTAQNQTNA